MKHEKSFEIGFNVLQKLLHVALKKIKGNFDVSHFNRLFDAHFLGKRFFKKNIFLVLNGRQASYLDDQVPKIG